MHSAAEAEGEVDVEAAAVTDDHHHPERRVEKNTRETEFER